MPRTRSLSEADAKEAAPALSVYARIYDIVRQIPKGQVATYGQVAAIEGHCTARMVGYAMAALEQDDVPWQRVINGQGRISERRGGSGTSRQRLKLMEEGVHFDSKGRIDFEVFGWNGPDFVWIRDKDMFAAPPPWSR